MLSEMTLEELWTLFPIILKPHNPQYAKWYNEVESELKGAFAPGLILRINHIGSSAVAELLAKPTVDILMEVSDGTEVEALKKQLESLGWTLMAQRDISPVNLSFNKGYTPLGFAEKVYHLHVRNFDDWDELYFRDYLIEHSSVALEYAALKESLLVAFEHNRDAYTREKSEFVNKYSKEAKRLYGSKYAVLMQK